MIDEQDAQIFKSRDDYARNQHKFTQYLHYPELWQSTSIPCSYTAFICDVLLIVTFIAFLIRYRKMMQTMRVMLVAFLSMNSTGIPPAKANVFGRTFLPLFMINLPEKEQIIKDSDDIEGMQTVVQEISFLLLQLSLSLYCIKYVIDVDTRDQLSNIAFHSFLFHNYSETHVEQICLWKSPILQKVI